MSAHRKPGPPQNSGRGTVHLGSAIGKGPKPLAVAAEAVDGRPGAYSTLKRTAGPKRSRGHRSKGTPDEITAWRQQAFERVAAANDGVLLDEVTGRVCVEPVVHHPLEAGDLFTMRQAFTIVGGHPLVLHPDNAMVLDRVRHDQHHCSGPGRVPIPLAKLREETWDLVVWLDEQAGNEWWSMRLRGDYS